MIVRFVTFAAAMALLIALASSAVVPIQDPFYLCGKVDSFRFFHKDGKFEFVMQHRLPPNELRTLTLLKKDPNFDAKFKIITDAISSKISLCIEVESKAYRRQLDDNTLYVYDVLDTVFDSVP